LKLIDIPGIGTRMRDRLIGQYASEELALDAVLKGDVSGLLTVVSERQAIAMAQWAIGMHYGVKPGDFLATDEAKRIYQMLIERIAKYAHTDYARLKVGLLFPSSSAELIDENRKASQASVDMAAMLCGTEMDNLLGRIKPLKERSSQKVKERAVVAASTEAFNLLKSKGIDRLIDVLLAESPSEILDIARGYGHICVAGEMGNFPSGFEVEVADRLDEWYLVPESVLSYYSENLETLQSAVEASRLLQDQGLDAFEGLEELECLMKQLLASKDAESLRLKSQIDSLARCASEAADWANMELKKRIEASSITLAGVDLLQALGRGEGVRDIFEVQMRGTFQQVLKEAKAMAASNLALSGSDSVRLDEIFDVEIQYPMEIDRQALRRFEQDMRSRLASRDLKSKRDLAKKLSDKRNLVKKMISKLLDFDVSYALGKFALDNGLKIPEIADVPCLGFEDGHNLFLDKAEPVSYSLGETGMVEHPERIAILSGVNSGGKTSLLDLVSQMLILAQMGLPVPAKECRLGLFQELYYFTKSRGTLSAGAFETAMRKFAIVENSQRKLVLADELEAITEPGASAKIIACILDEINLQGSAAVFVSHLAEEVKRFSKTPIRVDGIEAEGLDAENNLVVRRTPRYNYLAKSTPELILDRLVRTTNGPEKEFYSRLLSRFR
jgi:DNA mismatch repair protein MutS2